MRFSTLGCLLPKAMNHRLQPVTSRLVRTYLGLMLTVFSKKLYFISIDTFVKHNFFFNFVRFLHAHLANTITILHLNILCRVCVQQQEFPEGDFLSKKLISSYIAKSLSMENNRRRPGRTTFTHVRTASHNASKRCWWLDTQAWLENPWWAKFTATIITTCTMANVPDSSKAHALETHPFSRFIVFQKVAGGWIERPHRKVESCGITHSCCIAKFGKWLQFVWSSDIYFCSQEYHWDPWICLFTCKHPCFWVQMSFRPCQYSSTEKKPAVWGWLVLLALCPQNSMAIWGSKGQHMIDSHSSSWSY